VNAIPQPNAAMKNVRLLSVICLETPAIPYFTVPHKARQGSLGPWHTLGRTEAANVILNSSENNQIEKTKKSDNLCLKPEKSMPDT
jgi:hypothetical protein